MTFAIALLNKKNSDLFFFRFIPGVQYKCSRYLCIINDRFRSYSSTGGQIVHIDSSQSNATPVPQGSKPGPLLSLLYIYDMYIVTNLMCIKFADDSTFYCERSLFKSAN